MPQFCMNPPLGKGLSFEGLDIIKNSQDSHLMALTQQGGPTLLLAFSSPSEERHEIECGKIGARVSRFSLSGDVLFMGCHDGTLMRCDLNIKPYRSTPIALNVEESDVGAQISCITRQQAADAFAVARGRKVFVLNCQGSVLVEIPLSAQAAHLHWLPATSPEKGATLVATSGDIIYTWTDNACECGPHLDGKASSYMALATAPATLHLAASTNTNQVLCWDLKGQLDYTGLLQPTLTLSGFDSPVKCMAWDKEGRFLATTDGSECNVWDVPMLSETANVTDAIVCCGHDPGSRITCIAFQPEGSMLATASDASKIVLFDTHAFRSGGVAGPCGVHQLDGGPVTVMKWASPTELMAGTATGYLTCIDVANQQAINPVQQQQQQQNNDTGVLEDAALGLQQLSVSEKPAPAAPAAVASRVTHVVPPPPPPPLQSIGGKQHPQQQLKLSVSGRTRSPGSSAALEPFTGSASSPHQSHPPPSHSPHQGDRRQSESGPDFNRKAGGRGGRGPGGAGRSNSGGLDRPGAGGPQGCLSPALMHHIQQIRDNPNAPRSDQAEQLTGWGLGSSGGGNLPWVPATPNAPQGMGVGMAPMQFPMPYQGMAMQYQMVPTQGMGQGMPTYITTPVGSPSGALPQGQIALASDGSNTAAAAAMMQRSTAMMQAAPWMYNPQAMQQAAAMHQGAAMQQPWGATMPPAGYMPYQTAYTIQPAMDPMYAAAAAAAMMGQHGPTPAVSPSHTSNVRNNNSGTGASNKPESHLSDKEADRSNNSPSNSSPTLHEHNETGFSQDGGDRSPTRGGSGSDFGSEEMRDNEREGGPHHTHNGSSNNDNNNIVGTSRSSGSGKASSASVPSGGGDHPPDSADPALGTVYIGNLHAAVDESTLGWMCSHFGPVTHVQVIRDKSTQASRGFAFVTFAHPAYATLAMQQMNGQMLQGPFGDQRVRVAPTNQRKGVL